MGAFVVTLCVVAAGGADAPAASRLRVEARQLDSHLTWPRLGPRAVALADGSALVVGGGSRTLVRFDPDTEVFSTLPARLRSARLWPTVTVLADGRVLIAGGAKGKGNGDTAEVFDPVTGTVGEPIHLERVRIGHTATRLPDGQVLLAGGDATAEIFDPTINRTRGPYALAFRRRGHSATRLADGRVLLAGGGRAARARSQVPGDRSAERFDVERRRSAAVAVAMRDSRDEHAAFPLPDGRVLLAGGQRASDGKTHDRSDIFDPVAGTFTPGPDLPVDCQDVAVIPLGRGRVLLIGGESDDGPGGKPDRILDQITLFDAATMRFTRVGRLVTPRDDFAACRLRDGRILVVGGLSRFDIPTRTAEILTLIEEKRR